MAVAVLAGARPAFAGLCFVQDAEGYRPVQCPVDPKTGQPLPDETKFMGTPGNTDFMPMGRADEAFFTKYNISASAAQANGRSGFSTPVIPKGGLPAGGGGEAKIPENPDGAAGPTAPPAQPQMTPEQIQAAMQAIRDRVNASQGQMDDRVLGPYLDGLQNALKDPKNAEGLDQAFFDNLGKVMDQRVQLAQYRWKEQRGRLSPEERRQKEELEASYNNGEPMMAIMGSSLGKVYMDLDKRTPDFKPDDNHDQGWVNRYPDDPMARLFRGRNQLEGGNAKGALDSFNEALGLDPTNAAALSGRAAANFQMGNIQAAYEDAKAALALDPNDKAAFATMKLAEGRGASAGGSSGQAVGQGASGAGASGGPGGAASAASALSLPSGNSQSLPHVRDAASAMRLGDYNAAIARATRAIELDARNAMAYYLRAAAYSRQARYDLASRDAMAGLRLAPRSKPLLITRAFSSNRTKDYKDAMAAANAALELDPRSADAFANRAYAIGALGDRNGMIEQLKQAAALDARYKKSLDSALQMPQDSDLLFLFPGEALPSKGAGGASASAGAKGKRFGMVAIGSLIGGLLLALGFLTTVAGPLTTRVKSAFTSLTRRSPAVATTEGGSLPAMAPLNGPPAGALRGQYTIVRQIGAGGMGIVYEGQDASLGRRVAIKKMRDELRLNRRDREGFITEAKMVAALHHSNIVDIYAIVEEKDDIYLVFEYVTGKTVYALVGAQGALPWGQAMGILKAMASALDFAHSKNIIHRDLKPSNVMIDDDGYVKVMDFGIARAAKDAATRYSMTNNVVGTPPYMAPEQEQGVVRKESDVYSLAVCFYEMLCGKLPFIGSGAGMLMNKVNMSYVAPSAMVSGLPAGIDELFAKALHPDPDQRFRSARELVAALEALSPVNARV